MMDSGSCHNLIALDLNTCDSLSDEGLSEFLELIGPQLQGLVVSGIPPLLESFWLANIPRLKEIKYDWNFKKMSDIIPFKEFLSLPSVGFG